MWDKHKTLTGNDDKQSEYFDIESRSGYDGGNDEINANGNGNATATDDSVSMRVNHYMRADINQQMNRL